MICGPNPRWKHHDFRSEGLTRLDEAQERIASVFPRGIVRRLGL